jgi:aminomethyltransferase
MTSVLQQTPLFDWHAAHGARMVDFAGWSMPVQYTSIVAEHVATRSAVGLFDVSHMGRFEFEGPDAERFLDRIVTRRVTGMKPGVIRYSLVTNDDGGILDDVLVYHLVGLRGRSDFQMVVNASNRQKIWDWFAQHRGSDNVEIVDVTLDTAMIAVQGPRAIEIARPLAGIDPATLRYYHGAAAQIAGAPGIVSRTGYTGEDGCELIVPADVAGQLWRRLIDSAAAVEGGAAGLGARDTLRLEAGMPLYGHELSEAVNPFQAGLDYAVDLADRSFPGSDALAKLAVDSTQPRRVGMLADGKRVPREGYAIHYGDRTVGYVTSGTFSPTLNRPIAMGYIEPSRSSPGTAVTIDVRGHDEPARVAELPFYRRPSS